MIITSVNLYITQAAGVNTKGSRYIGALFTRRIEIVINIEREGERERANIHCQVLVRTRSFYIGSASADSQ